MQEEVVILSKNPKAAEIKQHIRKFLNAITYASTRFHFSIFTFQPAS